MELQNFDDGLDDAYTNCLPQNDSFIFDEDPEMPSVGSTLTQGRDTPITRPHYNTFNWPDQQIPSSASQQLATILEQLMTMFQEVHERVGSLESQVESITNSQITNSSGASPEEKKRIPSQLTVRIVGNYISSTLFLVYHYLIGFIQKTVAMVHEALDENCQFKPDLG